MARRFGGDSGPEKFDLKSELSREQIRSGLKILLWIPLILIVVIGGCTAAYTVQPEGRAVLKRFGKVIAIKEPGLHFKIPFGVDKQYFVPTERVLKEEFGFRTVRAAEQSQYQKRGYDDESLMLTGDLNVIDVEWVVQYRISDPDKFLHQVRQPSQTIRDISEAVMRRIVGNRLGSEVLTVARAEIALETQEEMQKILDSYDMGILVKTVELQDVTPPDPVKPAFNEVNEARQEKERLINEAEKRRNQEIPRAQGEAKQTIAEAEGYKAERVNRAQGEATRFTELRKAYSEAPEVTRQRLYLEMIDTVLPNVGKVYVVEENQAPPLPLLHLEEPGAQAKKEASK
jgi:membrane protease subunit HflK